MRTRECVIPTCYDKMLQRGKHAKMCRSCQNLKQRLTSHISNRKNSLEKAHVALVAAEYQLEQFKRGEFTK